MSVAAIRDGLSGVIDDISSLKVYHEAPANLHEVPCAIFLPPSGDYDNRFGGGTLHMFPVLVLVSLSQGHEAAQNALDAYVSPSGSSSVKATIAASKTLGGNVDWARVVRYRDYGGHEYPADSGKTFLGAIFEIECYENA